MDIHHAMEHPWRIRLDLEDLIDPDLSSSHTKRLELTSYILRSCCDLCLCKVLVDMNPTTPLLVDEIERHRIAPG